MTEPDWSPSPCLHQNKTRVFDDLGEMRMQSIVHADGSTGLELVARVIGWHFRCRDCGALTSVHGTSRPPSDVFEKESDDAQRPPA